MKDIKNVIALFLMIALFSSCIAVPASATEFGKTIIGQTQIADIVSTEFPDAYILCEYYNESEYRISESDGKIVINIDRGASSSTDNRTLTIRDPALAQALENNKAEIIGIINATAFFEEEFAITDNRGQDSIIIKCSKLLSQEEVISIGIENFGCTNQPLPRSSSTTYNSRGRLDITFVMANLTVSGYESAYSLTAYSSWDGMPLFPGLGGSNDPGLGDDYMGFTWGGEYDYYNSSASATREILGNQTVYLADALPGSGLVWSFEEFNYYQGVGYDYVTDATCSCNIRKAHLSGGGNTTSTVFKYIHTYQQHSGSLSISAGAEGISASYSLSGVSNQWSLVCTFNSMPY